MDVLTRPSYASFDAEINFPDKYLTLYSWDGVVYIHPRDVPNFTEAEKQIARNYAQYHLRRTGQPFVKCMF